MNERDTGAYDLSCETDFATGCSMFFTRQALEDVGLLDPRFFMYFEDAEWCVRARRRGYRIRYTPASVINHHVSASTKIDSPLYLYFTMRNKLLLVRMHAPGKSIFLNLPYFLYFYGRQFIRMGLKWRSWKGVRAIWWGIIDGMFMRTGSNGEGRLGRLQAQ